VCRDLEAAVRAFGLEGCWAWKPLLDGREVRSAPHAGQFAFSAHQSPVREHGRALSAQVHTQSSSCGAGARAHDTRHTLA